MRALRASWRLARCLVHTLHGLALCALAFPRLDARARRRHVQRWSARMLGALDVDCQVEGAAHDGPVLLVANHVSWLDILAINAVQPARFVAKAEVHRWPLLGRLVAAGGTLFIERERKRDALRVLHQVAAALAAGDVVALFPEGTTSAGEGVLPFHANLLQAALSAGAPLQPLALRYRDARSNPSRAAAYVGETSLVASLWQVLRADRLCVRMTLLAVEPSLLERRAMAARLRERIVRALDA